VFGQKSDPFKQDDSTGSEHGRPLPSMRPDLTSDTEGDFDFQFGYLGGGASQSGKRLSSKEGGKPKRRGSKEKTPSEAEAEAMAEAEALYEAEVLAAAEAERLSMGKPSTAESSEFFDSLSSHRPDSAATLASQSGASLLPPTPEHKDDLSRGGGGASPSSHQAGGQRRFPAGRLSSSQQVRVVTAEEEKEEEQKEEKEPSPEEIQKELDLQELKKGKLFRVKAKAEEIVDEFARMLLPPPPSKGLTDSFSLQGTPSGSGSGSVKEAGQSSHRSDPTSSGQSSHRSRHQEASTVIWTPGLRSTLAEDFRTAINEAWKKIDVQDNDKDEVAKTMINLQRRTSELLPMPPLSAEATAEPSLVDNLFAGSSEPDLQNEPTLLETHLRLRAERHGKRMQHRAERSLKSSDCWDRRKKVCQQFLNSFDALSMFVELQRQQLATA